MSAGGDEAPRLGVVCGLVSEGALLSGRPVQVRPVAGNSVRATEEVRALARNGVGALLSFGLAGGLVPSCDSGTVIVADAVIAGSETLPCDPRLLEALSRELPVAAVGRIVGSGAAVLTVEDKAALAERSGALAVDMESHAVARAARDAGLPFAVLRAVADPADRAIPSFALAGLHADGTVGAWPVVKGLLRRPWCLSAILRLGRDSKAAHRALGQAVAAGIVERMLEAAGTD